MTGNQSRISFLDQGQTCEYQRKEGEQLVSVQNEFDHNARSPKHLNSNQKRESLKSDTKNPNLSVHLDLETIPPRARMTWNQSHISVHFMIWSKPVNTQERKLNSLVLSRINLTIMLVASKTSTVIKNGNYSRVIQRIQAFQFYQIQRQFHQGQE